MLCLGRILQHPDSNEAWKNRVAGVRAERSYRDYDAINGEPTEFGWNIFPRFTTLHLCGKINDLLSDLGRTPETFTGKILFLTMSNDISCDRKKATKMNAWQMPESPKYLREDLVLDWSFIGPVLKRSGVLKRIVPKELGIILRKKCCWNSHADQDTVDTIYRIILSVNQLSFYGAGATICEEFEHHQDRTGQPVILVGQSIVLGEVKSEAFLHDEDPMNDQIIWQQYIQQVESVSP